MIISLILCILGIVGGGIVTYWFTKSKKPFWYYESNKLFSNGVAKIDELKIIYKDHTVNNLSRIYLVFWNNGKETIKSSDIAEDIYFCVPNPYKIYNAQIIKTTTPSNDFKINISDNENAFNLSFKYLDHKQGAVIQVFTDCDKKNDYELKGIIMGCKKIYRDKAISNRLRLLLAGITISIFFMGFSELLILFEGMENNTNFILGNIIDDICWFAATIIIFIVLLIIDERSMNPIHKIPKTLREYFQNN